MAHHVTVSQLEEYLDRDEWRYTLESDHFALTTTQRCTLKLIIKLDDERDVLRFFAYYPFRVPEDQRDRAAQTLVRMNYGLILGGCEMDYRDGELRYHYGLTIDDAGCTYEQFRACIHTVLHTADRYFPAFMAVIYGGTDPAAAIAAVEDPAPSPPPEA